MRAFNVSSSRHYQHRPRMRWYSSRETWNTWLFCCIFQRQSHRVILTCLWMEWFLGFYCYIRFSVMMYFKNFWYSSTEIPQSSKYLLDDIWNTLLLSHNQIDGFHSSSEENAHLFDTASRLLKWITRQSRFFILMYQSLCFHTNFLYLHNSL